MLFLFFVSIWSMNCRFSGLRKLFSSGNSSSKVSVKIDPWLSVITPLSTPLMYAGSPNGVLGGNIKWYFSSLVLLLINVDMDLIVSSKGMCMVSLSFKSTVFILGLLVNLIFPIIVSCWRCWITLGWISFRCERKLEKEEESAKI